MAIASMTIPHPKDQTFCVVEVQPQHILTIIKKNTKNKHGTSNVDKNLSVIDTEVISVIPFIESIIFRLVNQ